MQSDTKPSVLMGVQTGVQDIWANVYVSIIFTVKSAWSLIGLDEQNFERKIFNTF